MATTQDTGAREDCDDVGRWRALAVTLVVGFMTLLDVTIVNVAIPSIQQSLHASSQGVQWVVSGYALTFGLTLVAGGRLGDLLGRRRMFLVGLVAFTLTSAAAGAAPTETLLVTARLAQGVAAGLLTPQNTGLIQQLFKGEERGRAFGIFGTTVGVSSAAGPVLGGVILALFGEQDGWRYVFFVNVPIGILAMILAVKLIPAAGPRVERLRTQIDFIGALLLGLAIVNVLLPLVDSMGDPKTRMWFLTPLAVVFGVLFVRWERRLIARDTSPLLDVRLFGGASGFSSGIALGSVYFVGFSGIWLVLALFFQDGLDYSPLQSGLAVTPFAIGSATSAVLAGRLVARFDRWLTVGGLTLVVLGFAAVAILVPATLPDRTALVVLGPLLVAGLGAGAVISPNITLTLSEVPPQMGGAAGGALQTGQRIGSAMGAAVLATAFRLTLQDVSGDYGAAIAVTFACSLLFMLVALALAVFDLRGRRRDRVVRTSSGYSRTRS
jgi:EmrB/QacA subfamily drug resistance transporter